MPTSLKSIPEDYCLPQSTRIINCCEGRDCYSTFQNPTLRVVFVPGLTHLTHVAFCAQGKSPESLMCHRRMSIVDALSASSFSFQHAQIDMLLQWPTQ
ncbi:hypothetical protein TNCT_636821 [Trichonephila clavata]|uniref:Uncharacterized protein n=1 Tax=Trichonephila clavata TaxID=2740835 RepID=A0A8X6LT38_TRICU|nr:hypothetical protein TNCT_636821 [Trichonephila clavata]